MLFKCQIIPMENLVLLSQFFCYFFVYIVIFRTAVLVQEVKYNKHLYVSDRLWNLASKVYSLSEAQKVIAIIGVGSVAYLYKNTNCSLVELTNSFLIFALVYSAILYASCVHSPYIQRTQLIRASNSDNYGSGMAYSYFYGYLSIILPVTGDSNKDIIERICDYVDTQNVNIPIRKMFILMPKSMYIPCDLCQFSSKETMSQVSNLEDVIRNRGGIRSRKYTNSVYKLHHSSEYVVAEGATPLQTFYESMAFSKEMREMRLETLQQFHDTLQRLLWDNLNCRNKCELLMYDDVTKDGNPIDIAEILKKRIGEIQPTTS